MIARKELVGATGEDNALMIVEKYIQDGWSDMIAHKIEMKPYWTRRDGLSSAKDVIWWGSKIVIPRKLQSRTMILLHEGHPGIVRMKSLARSYFWWSTMDLYIEEVVKECVEYQENFWVKCFFVMVDAYSKWMEVLIMQGTTSKRTIEEIRKIFSTHGIPEVIASDNGKNFASQEFKEFMDENSIKHMFTHPYHPSSNGLAERTVQTLNKALRSNSESNIELSISRFLLQYRITPHSTTNISPSEMLMSRRIRLKLDCIFPYKDEIYTETMISKEELKSPKQWKTGDCVLAVDFRQVK